MTPKVFAFVRDILVSSPLLGFFTLENKKGDIGDFSEYFMKSVFESILVGLNPPHIPIYGSCDPSQSPTLI